jgi:hypothetical protein
MKTTRKHSDHIELSYTEQHNKPELNNATKTFHTIINETDETEFKNMVKVHLHCQPATLGSYHNHTNRNTKL